MNWETEHTNQAWEFGMISPETVVDETTPSPLQQYIFKESLGKAFEEITKLPRREVKVIMLRDYEGRTLEEVRRDIVNIKTGKPVSRERVRQLGDRALEKVRQALIEGGYGLE